VVSGELKRLANDLVRLSTGVWQNITGTNSNSTAKAAEKILIDSAEKVPVHARFLTACSGRRGFRPLSPPVAGSGAAQKTHVCCARMDAQKTGVSAQATSLVSEPRHPRIPPARLLHQEADTPCQSYPKQELNRTNRANRAVQYPRLTWEWDRLVSSLSP
jgi:hypothetical protein